VKVSIGVNDVIRVGTLMRVSIRTGDVALIEHEL